MGRQAGGRAGDRAGGSTGNIFLHVAGIGDINMVSATDASVHCDDGLEIGWVGYGQWAGRRPSGRAGGRAGGPWASCVMFSQSLLQMDTLFSQQAFREFGQEYGRW